MFKIENISVGYETVLFRVDELCVEENTCVAVIGDNGKGKTSLFRCIAGIQEPLEGEVDREMLPASDVAFVGTQRPQMEYLTVQDYLNFGFSSELTDGSKSMMKAFKLDIELNAELSTLSDGQFKRLSIIRQLQKKPKLLLLDEPSAHLDRKNKSLLLDLINQQLKNELSILFTSHDYSFGRQIADKVYELENGALKLLTGFPE